MSDAIPMPLALPGMYIVRACPSDTKPCRYVVCVSQYNYQKKVWNTTILDDSRLMIRNVNWKYEAEDMPAFDYIHERVNEDMGTSYYISKMGRTKKYLDIEYFGRVYEYKITRPNTILPAKFYRVYNGEDSDMRWHFIDGVNPAYIFKIPSHVKEKIIELAVLKGEQCPVTMDPLTRINTVCTPCGHLFSRGVLKEGVGKCPICREKISLLE